MKSFEDWLSEHYGIKKKKKNQYFQFYVSVSDSGTPATAPALQGMFDLICSVHKN